MTEEVFAALAAPFPPSEIEWRVGSTDGAKEHGLALAYLTARHVMERLDDVMGPANWQDRYEFNGTTTICYLSLRVDDQWVTKADGAGASDVEAEKGAISDALKRAAVKWGIGRYLYALGNSWVDIEPAGRSYRIKKDQFGKLESMLATRFGAPEASVGTSEPIGKLSSYRAQTIINTAAILTEIDAPQRTVKELTNLRQLYVECNAWMPGGWATRLIERIDHRLSGMGDGGSAKMDTAYAETMRSDPPPQAADPKFAVSAEALALAGLKPTVGEQLDRLQADPGYGKP